MFCPNCGRRKQGQSYNYCRQRSDRIGEKANDDLFIPGAVLLVAGGYVGVLGYVWLSSMNLLEAALPSSEYATTWHMYNAVMWIGIVLGCIGLLLIIKGVWPKKTKIADQSLGLNNRMD